jgi:GntR family transcriptional repressor for pyruvate dehydrogenase complex
MVDTSYGKINRKLLPEQISDEIQDQITGHQLDPGDQLPSGRVLAEQFGVSRQCVREAYKILEERGLVVVVHGRGAFVADFEPHHIQSQLSIAAERGNITSAEVFEVRRCLECHIAGLAAERATPRDLARLGAAIEKMKDTVDKPEEFIVADNEFHMVLAEASQNQLFSILAKPLSGVTMEYRKDVIQVPGSAQTAIEGHTRILECLEKRDITGSQTAMEEHLETFRRDAGTSSLK